MKKIFSLAITAVFAFCLNVQNSTAQPHLRIDTLLNFPLVPGDTAIQGQVYNNIRIVVTNIGNNHFFGDIHVYLYSQSVGASSYDTLRDGPFPYCYIPIGQTDTISANPNYQFRTIHYAAGDNIIVVWPYSSNTSFDTYSTHMYFSITTGINSPHEPTFSTYPNPVSKFIRVNYADENKVEQVRIYDLAGREVYSIREAVRTIDLDAAGVLDGIYFLEIRETSGKTTVKKILVTTN
jgi:hypothetical protein